MMDLPIHIEIQNYTTLQFVNVNHRRGMHMAAQSTGATDIAFKGQQRYTISEHHKIMYGISILAVWPVSQQYIQPR